MKYINSFFKIMFMMCFGLLACHENTKVGDDAFYELADLEVIPTTLQPEPNEPAPVIQESRKLIKSGRIDFRSQNVSQDYDAIKKSLGEFQAYVENETQSRSSHRISYDVVIKVPAAEFDSLFNLLSSISDHIDHKSSVVEDVTSEYYDLELRIKNSLKLENRYLKLLDRANEMKDILAIERKISQVRLEIEGLQGRLKFMGNQIKFSTIELSFYEVLPYSYQVAERKGFGNRMLASFDSGWQGFLTFLTLMAAIWPLLVIASALVIIYRRYKLKYAKVEQEKTD